MNVIAIKTQRISPRRWKAYADEFPGLECIDSQPDLARQELYSAILNLESMLLKQWRERQLPLC